MIIFARIKIIKSDVDDIEVRVEMRVGIEIRMRVINVILILIENAFSSSSYNIKISSVYLELYIVIISSFFLSCIALFRIFIYNSH